MGVAERFKGEGTYVYLWLIHVVVWQKPTQYCKTIALQLKKIFFNIIGFQKQTDRETERDGDKRETKTEMEDLFERGRKA